MLDGNFLTGRGEIEHVEDDGLAAAVLAAMDSANDLDQGFTFVEGFLRAILADDGQLALLYNAIVDDGMMMPAGLGADGRIIRNSGVPFGKSGRMAPSQLCEVRISSVVLIVIMVWGYSLRPQK